MIEPIFLIGFRATGKTTAGKRLARKLNCAFIDTDQQICLKKGATVQAIVEREGWEGFRRCEREVLGELADAGGCVVATGGGAVLHRELWRDLKKKATVVWLRAERDVLLQRILKDESTAASRPSLSGKGLAEEMEEILNEREPLYREIADCIVDTGQMAIDEAVDSLLKKVATIKK